MIRNVLYNNTYIIVLLSLIGLIVTLPFFEDNENNVLFTIIFSFPLISGIFASLEQKSLMRFGILLGLSALVLNIIISWESPNILQSVVRFLVFLGFLLFVSFVILKKVVRSKEIDLNIIAGAISVYLILALIFSLLFSLIYYYNPESFNHGLEKLDSRDFLYYSIVTLTTLGYGDISPLAPAARSMSLLLVILGQMYLTILVAILVSKFKGWKKLQDKELE